MSKYGLDRQTVLDISVNIIPLFILIFFFALFIVYDPFLWKPFPVGVSLILIIIPFVLLALLTYVAGRTIQESEKQ